MEKSLSPRNCCESRFARIAELCIARSNATSGHFHSLEYRGGFGTRQQAGLHSFSANRKRFRSRTSHSKLHRQKTGSNYENRRRTVCSGNKGVISNVAGPDSLIRKTES